MPLVAQSDFNFDFYPLPTYSKTTITPDFDSTANDYKMRSDTILDSINISVTKENGLFSIVSLANVSKTVYQSRVTFDRVNDSGLMVYICEAGEKATIDPIHGTVEIEFIRCADVPIGDDKSIVKKVCATTIHKFGFKQ